MEIMAIRHIRLTRSAAVTVQTSSKYFLAKKRFNELKTKILNTKKPDKTGRESTFNIMLYTNKSFYFKAL